MEEWKKRIPSIPSPSSILPTYRVDSKEELNIGNELALMEHLITLGRKISTENFGMVHFGTKLS
ncbi:hypothetical protein HYR99_34570 [Candidatus Poribacteria bacterium]|nr:hypothetical protein [Candidatus Poribacteria bacterium]